MSGLIKAQDHKDKSIIHSLAAIQNNGFDPIALFVDTDMIKSTFTEEYTSNETGTTILTPASGYKLCVRDIEVVTDASSGEVQIDFVTSSKKVFRLYASALNRSTAISGHVLGAVDEVLKLTTTTGSSKVFVRINYVQHK